MILWAVASPLPVTDDSFEPVPIQTPAAPHFPAKPSAEPEKPEPVEGPEEALGSASIAGVVASQHGVAVANAAVILSCACLTAQREGLTNTRGVFSFTELPAGTYTVSVFSGRNEAHQSVTLADATRQRVNFTLEAEAEIEEMILVGPASTVICTLGPSGCRCRTVTPRQRKRAERRARRDSAANE